MILKEAPIAFFNIQHGVQQSNFYKTFKHWKTCKQVLEIAFRIIHGKILLEGYSFFHILTSIAA